MRTTVELGKSWLRPLYRPLRSGVDRCVDLLGQLRRDGALVESAQRYWETATSDGRGRSSAHFQDGDAFEGDAERWLRIGREHLELYQTFARALGASATPQRVIEWGCGGGANAVHFAPLCREFVGVDIAQATLDECGRQIARFGSAQFTPVQIDVAEPEGALSRIEGRFDLFLCTYVFELVPSRAYGLRLLAIAKRLLAPGGMALIQIKYPERAAWASAKRWNYAKNHANATQYPIEEFWLEAQRLGLAPKLVSLVPEQPLVGDQRYAYFCLTDLAPSRAT